MFVLAHMQVEIVESGYPLTVVALASPAAALFDGHAVERAERARLDHHFREVAGLFLLIRKLTIRGGGGGERGGVFLCRGHLMPAVFLLVDNGVADL